jgi:hypothetical protein
MSIAIGRPVINTDRPFFSGMALASALILLIGFLPSYFHRSAELPPLTLLYQLCTAPCSPHGSFFWLRKPPWWLDAAPTSIARWAQKPT